MAFSTGKSPSGILDEDHDVFIDEISDAALENAAATVRGRTPSLTIAFCSGLDECPVHALRGPTRTNRFPT